ncbi:MAG: gliding motility-associated C-terminal domain-containing protein [Bacteroidota bacterium]|nr:gliding motility-associated C-terminal domain-containing protein [Bacteroidota bacterium]
MLIYIDLLLVNNKFRISLKKPKATMLLAFGFLFISFNNIAQVNYVQNPSFEILDSCRDNLNFQYPPLYWDTLRAGGGGGPEICSTCATWFYLKVPYSGYGSFQIPKTGNNYCFYTNYYPTTSQLNREYIQNELKQNLKQNKSYCVTYYLSLLNESKYAITEYGAYFDDGSIKTTFYGTSTLTPQVKSPIGIYLTDTLNWTKVQGTFTANGTESYLTLGNFKSTANTSFSTMPIQTNGVQRFVADYYIDDVSVIEADLPAYAGRDTVLCTGDSVFIGRPPEVGLECIWFNNNTQIATGGGIWVKPATTQTYVVSQNVCGLIKTDTIQVQLKPKYTGTVSITAQASPSLVCSNSTVQLSIQTPTISNYTYNWQPQNLFTINNTQTVIATFQQNIQFTVTAYNPPTDAFCPYSLTATINVNAKPTYTLTPKINLTNTVRCLNDTLKFSVINTPTASGVMYNWQPFNLFINTNSTTATALIQNYSYYFVILTSLTDDLLNCPFTKKDSIYISLQDTCNKQTVLTYELILPQLISANGDGINDEIIIQLPNTKSATLKVFNRWGSLVAERTETNPNPSTPLRVTWNGTYKNQPLPAGTYFYVVESVNTNDEQKNYRQFVVLVR